MRGQELGKQLMIKTEGLELGNSESEYGTEFVQCVPSPHSCSLSNLRRNSLPATNGNCSNGSAIISRTASLSTPTPQGSSQGESKGCSAKKVCLLDIHTNVSLRKAFISDVLRIVRKQHHTCFGASVENRQVLDPKDRRSLIWGTYLPSRNPKTGVHLNLLYCNGIFSLTLRGLRW